MRGQLADLDDRDQAILSARRDALDAETGPRVGDYVDFADGITRRIAYIWPDDGLPGVQTCDGGSFYLGNGYLSMSGSLYNGIHAATLTDTGELRDARIWFFHHDWRTRDNGIDAVIPMRVYRCTEPAPAI